MLLTMLDMGGLPLPMLVGNADHMHNYLTDPAKGVQPSLLLNLCQGRKKLLVTLELMHEQGVLTRALLRAIQLLNSKSKCRQIFLTCIEELTNIPTIVWKIQLQA